MTYIEFSICIFTYEKMYSSKLKSSYNVNFYFLQAMGSHA